MFICCTSESCFILVDDNFENNTKVFENFHIGLSTKMANKKKTIIV